MNERATQVGDGSRRLGGAGYVANFPSSMDSSSATHGMWLLKNFHIDEVQFYDWQWKHHVPLAGTVSSPASSWENINGTTNYASAIDNYINGAHYYAISAVNYNLAYGAFAGSWPGWKRC